LSPAVVARLQLATAVIVLQGGVPSREGRELGQFGQRPSHRVRDEMADHEGTAEGGGCIGEEGGGW
jgi:hypothetical protein